MDIPESNQSSNALSFSAPTPNHQVVTSRHPAVNEASTPTTTAWVHRDTRNRTCNTAMRITPPEDGSPALQQACEFHIPCETIGSCASQCGTRHSRLSPTGCISATCTHTLEPLKPNESGAAVPLNSKRCFRAAL
eukprot:TRINITY_DN21566_c0_g1_i2.p1 TRINITY_DN21566_c0_g1~~TRINITY_DN21566_c0_g1_i2.p1  ORF type:complete len:135 (+),score=13.41 TRINITY_DN21566_c0_g1_i2:281-685(+)